MKSKSGIHTFCLINSRQGYQNLQAVIESAYDRRYKVNKKSDKYNLDHFYDINEYAGTGIRIHIAQFAAHPGFVRVILTPGSILSNEYNPTLLFKAKEKEWTKIQKKYKQLIQLDGIPDNLDSFSLNRIDITWDFYLDHEEEVLEWVRVLKKVCVRHGTLCMNLIKKTRKRV